MIRCIDAEWVKTLKDSIIKTKDILKQFNITRPTLHNWINSELLTPPEKDWRGWRMWTKQHVNEIETIIKRKEGQYTLPIIEATKLQVKNRRYLGSKFKLLDFISDVVEKNCDEIETFADIFAGTGVVADYFNLKGKNVYVNDILHSNYLSYLTWFSDEKIDFNKIEYLLKKFNTVDVNEDNYMSLHFGGTYFTIENARKIGFIREEIERNSNYLSERERAILITSLLYAMDKVANTVGHYDAYRRNLDSTKKLNLLIPDYRDRHNNGNKIYKEDANELVKRIEADLVYIDPPYNSRQYSDAYHLLENVAEWKKPNVTGVAKKMPNRQHIKSNYCTMKATDTFADLIMNINSKYILVSYNNMAQKGVGRSNAKISADDIIDILSSKGNVRTFEADFNAFTTGKSKISDHKEILYLCTVER